MKAVHSHRHRMARQQGFTLIEALIAFVILSIGLLGIVSLQTMAKTSQHQAIQRTRAITLADAIVERIRINPAGLSTYIASNPVGDDPNGPEPSPDCRAAPCDPNELADHDLWAWEQAMTGNAVQAGGQAAGGLIEPFACVSFTAAPDPNGGAMASTGLLNIIIQWQGLKDTRDAVQAGDTVCGGDAAGTDPNRRQLVVNTFVIDEGDL